MMQVGDAFTCLRGESGWVYQVEERMMKWGTGSNLARLVAQLQTQLSAAEVGRDAALGEVEELKRQNAEQELCDDNATDAENALVGIRMALDDLAIRANQTAEGTRSAVEALCVQLRREGRVWTGESLGGLTCPAKLQREDNAALKQQVFTHLGKLILEQEHIAIHGFAELVQQFDLLGRDL